MGYRHWMRLWTGMALLGCTLGCADDLDDEDPFLDDRRDDDVEGPPIGGRATCRGLNGTFVSEDVLIAARDRQRVEFEEGALVLDFDAATDTFTSTLDDGPAREGEFAVFADRLVLSEPLFDGVLAPGTLDCALSRGRLHLEGRVFFDLSTDDETRVERADLIAFLIRAPTD